KRSYSQLFLKRSRYQPHARRSRRVSSIDEFQACARPSFASGTDGSNPASSSSQSVSAVNPEAIGEKPRTLAAVCGWLGTREGTRRRRTGTPSPFLSDGH